MDWRVSNAGWPAVCKRLIGVLVTCPRCGHRAGRLIKVRHRFFQKRTEYVLHCRHCHRHRQVSFGTEAVRMVAEVVPEHVDRLFGDG